MMLSNLKHAGLVIGGCNAVGYTITAATETHKITDLVGVGSFVAATLSLSYKNGLIQNVLAGNFTPTRVLLVNLGVVVWGVRLATHLFTRVLSVGEDKRLRKFFREPGEGYLDINKSFFPVRLATFWTIQSLWGFICMLPVTLLNSVPFLLPDGSKNPLLSVTFNGLNGLTDKLDKITYPLANLISKVPQGAMVCSVLCSIGILGSIAIEWIADEQKNQYRNDKKNDGHWCDQGLFSLARYPNYFGEMSTWWTIFLTSIPALSLPQVALSLLSPSFITFLLFKLSGIPLLEKKNQKEYGDNEEYKKYVKNTNLLIPLPKFNKDNGKKE